MWKNVQKSAFTPEINAVKENSRNNLKNQLGLQLDENGVLRCHGRLISEHPPTTNCVPKTPSKEPCLYKLSDQEFLRKVDACRCISHISSYQKRILNSTRKIICKKSSTQLLEMQTTSRRTIQNTRNGSLSTIKNRRISALCLHRS